MTDRDHFAAAALTGLLCNGDYSMESTPVLAWRMADAMLRERERRVTEPMPKEKRAEVSDRFTDAEREAIERGYCSLMGVEDMSAECTRWDAEAAATLRGLLDRLGGCE